MKQGEVYEYTGGGVGPIMTHDNVTIIRANEETAEFLDREYGAAYSSYVAVCKVEDTDDIHKKLEVKTFETVATDKDVCFVDMANLKSVQNHVTSCLLDRM